MVRALSERLDCHGDTHGHALHEYPDGAEHAEHIERDQFVGTTSPPVDDLHAPGSGAARDVGP
jgi:hypothetical protein